MPSARKAPRRPKWLNEKAHFRSVHVIRIHRANIGVLTGYRPPAGWHPVANHSRDDMSLAPMPETASALPTINGLATALHHRADDAELFHPELERGAVHAQARGRTPWPGDHPLRVRQCRHDVTAFHVLQRLRLSIAVAGGRPQFENDR